MGACFGSGRSLRDLLDLIGRGDGYTCCLQRCGQRRIRSGPGRGQSVSGIRRLLPGHTPVRDQPDANASPQDARAEASRILTRSLANATIDPNDRAYLAKLIAARAGISQQDAEKRIDDTVAQMKAAEEKAKQAADAARKASASASFYLFFSMLIGAFIASTAGAIGGRQRDL